MKNTCQLRLFVKFLILFLASRHPFDMLIANQGYLPGFYQDSEQFYYEKHKKVWLLQPETGSNSKLSFANELLLILNIFCFIFRSR